MIASMTGFARRETSAEWGTLVCELRSVNHRFLEAGFRLPDELRSAEGELRARLALRVRRGKVDCTVSYRRPVGAGGTLDIDALALERLLAAAQTIARAAHGPATRERARRAALARRAARGVGRRRVRCWRRPGRCSPRRWRT